MVKPDASVRLIRGEDYNRPRRPDHDSISYLKSLPYDVLAAEEEIHNFLNPERSGAEYPQTLSAALSAIEEIQNEVASLAGDEVASNIIETLAHIVSPYSDVASRKMLRATIGYAMHLATHRYGSHVLQTILQLTMRKKATIDMALHSDAPECTGIDILPSLTDLVIALVDELTPHVEDLAVHMCGSHVLRTVICALGGVELRQGYKKEENYLRRGKDKPGKKGKKGHESDETGGRDNSFRLIHIEDPCLDTNDPKIDKALSRLTEALTGKDVLPPGNLQELACHSSGGPLVSILLRVLTYRNANLEWRAKLIKWDEHNIYGPDRHLGISRCEPRCEVGSSAYALSERILCWQVDQETQEWAPDVIFGLAGEPRGSHCLETIMNICPNILHEKILRSGKFYSTSTLEDYATHVVGRYVVQTILATLRTEEQAEEVIAALEPLVRKGLLLDTKEKLRNITWKMVEASSVFGVRQESVMECLLAGFRSVNGKSSYKLEDCVRLLLDLRRPENTRDRIYLDVPGARSVHFLLRFEVRLCKPVLSGILDMDSQDLELLMKDGLGCRCVIDGILDGPIKEQAFKDAANSLIEKLQGRWVTISCDRIGQHVVQKLFFTVDAKLRRELVHELANGKARLSGNNIGRSILANCLIIEYESKPLKDWNAMVKKITEKDRWLKDIVSIDVVNCRKRKAPASKDLASK